VKAPGVRPVLPVVSTLPERSYFAFSYYVAANKAWSYAYLSNIAWTAAMALILGASFRFDMIKQE
jgi:hypothetical protein